MDAIVLLFLGAGRGPGKWEYNIVSFVKFGKENVHTDALCLKDKTAFVCYNVILLKGSVANERQNKQTSRHKTKIQTNKQKAL